MSVVRHAVFTSNQGLLESRHVSSCVGFLFRCYSDPNYARRLKALSGLTPYDVRLQMLEFQAKPIRPRSNSSKPWDQTPNVSFCNQRHSTP
jgi:hypothetical protein